MNTLYISTNMKAMLFGAVLLTAGTLALVTPLFAHAATYAYVTTVGDVKSVVADDWMTAINIAPNRHLHSGVLLLKTSSDFTIVGDNVAAF